MFLWCCKRYLTVILKKKAYTQTRKYILHLYSPLQKRFYSVQAAPKVKGSAAPRVQLPPEDLEVDLNLKYSLHFDILPKRMVT